MRCSLQTFHHHHHFSVSSLQTIKNIEKYVFTDLKSISFFQAFECCLINLDDILFRLHLCHPQQLYQARMNKFIVWTWSLQVLWSYMWPNYGSSRYKVDIRCGSMLIQCMKWRSGAGSSINQAITSPFRYYS